MSKDAEVTISDGKTEVKTTVGALSKAAKQFSGPAVDVFTWANNLVSDREEYDIQLFFLSRNNVVYSLNTHSAIKDRLRASFLDNIMEDVLSLVDSGGLVRPYEETLKGDKNIAWLSVADTHRVKEVLLWIEEHASEIQRFKDEEHDIRRMKAIFARFTKPDAKTFYSFKQFAGKQAVSPKTDFVLRGDEVAAFYKDTAFKIDDSSQVVVVDDDIFVFRQTKFEQIFDTKPHMTAVANRNGSIIDERFNLSMPLVVQEIAILAQNSPTAMKKLSEADPNAMNQQQVVEAIEEYGIPLMQDDAGKIIIMDAKDVVCFLDVLSDNYLHGINGDYLAKSKKPFVAEPDLGDI